MDRRAVDAGRVLAGLGKLVLALVVALIDEDLVIDRARDDDELGARDVLRGELGILLRRRLRVALAHGDIGRNVELLEPLLVHAERLDDAWRHGEHRLDAGILHLERRLRIERQRVAQMRGDLLVVLPALLEGEVFVAVDLGAAEPERGEAALAVAGDPDAAGVDIFAPGGIAQEKVDVEADIDRALPELVGEIGDGRIVAVGPPMIGRGDDIAVRGEGLREPGVREPGAAPPMRQHDERPLLAVEGNLRVLVERELGEERHDERLCRALIDHGWIEHRHGERARPVMRVGKLDLFDPDGVGATGLRRRRGADDAKRKHGGEDGNAKSSQAPPHLILGPRPNTAMVPLPLTSMSPRGSDSNRVETCSQTSLVTATRPGVALSDMREATFTVSPQMSN